MAESVLSVLQPAVPESALVELPPHARLPRLDLGVDWESFWEEFPSSVRANFSGPRAPKYSELANIPGFRMDWIRGSLPPWLGMWMPNLLLAAIALWLNWVAIKERPLFSRFLRPHISAPRISIPKE